MMYASDRCPECNVAVGEPHERRCDVERCSNCGGQRYGCGCRHHDPDLSVWIGVWPGVVTAYAKGWFSRMTDEGWVECGENDPDAGPDLNRVAVHQMRRLQPLMRA